MKTNFEKLEETKHMLEWFSDSPFEEITSTLERMFRQQSASTVMLSFEITSEPHWLTGGRKTDDNKMILVRCGLAVACDFTLKDDNGVYDLNGVFTWVGAGLDSQPVTRMWMDLDGTLDEFGKDGILRERIFELDAE
ncbi:hypothetical protein [uncultured Fluviicola sp.]|uniref:hypothetical protein n=1 Tax=uncultured Fluviicola sp. TaxID=463303 RepID=UPI0025E8E08C|nr:hypothetical protein [uncultured Fluviicola sp.]